MMRLACFLLLAGFCLADHYGYKPKTNRCFQCEYRPPKTYSFKVPRQESYDVQVPKYTQECREEQVLSGHRYVKDEKKDDAHAHSGYGYQKQSYGRYEPVYTTVKRCHPKVEYETVQRSRTVYDTKTKTGPAGGFDPCMGPITAESAKADGVDDWECYDSCYTRTDAYGNVARGCFKGEFGLNPKNPHPQTMNGMTYRFCYGDHCNGDKIQGAY